MSGYTKKTSPFDLSKHTGFAHLDDASMSMPIDSAKAAGYSSEVVALAGKLKYQHEKDFTPSGDKTSKFSDEFYLQYAKRQLDGVFDSSFDKVLGGIDTVPDPAYAQYSYEEIITMANNGVNIPKAVLAWAKGQQEADVIDYVVISDNIEYSDENSDDKNNGESEINKIRSEVKDNALKAKKAQEDITQNKGRAAELTDYASDIAKEQKNIFNNNSIDKTEQMVKEWKELDKKKSEGKLSASETSKYKNLSYKLRKNGEIIRDIKKKSADLDDFLESIDNLNQEANEGMITAQKTINSASALTNLDDRLNTFIKVHAYKIADKSSGMLENELGNLDDVQLAYVSTKIGQDLETIGDETFEQIHDDITVETAEFADNFINKAKYIENILGMKGEDNSDSDNSDNEDETAPSNKKSKVRNSEPKPEQEPSIEPIPTVEEIEEPEQEPSIEPIPEVEEVEPPEQEPSIEPIPEVEEVEPPEQEPSIEPIPTVEVVEEPEQEPPIEPIPTVEEVEEPEQEPSIEPIPTVEEVEEPEQEPSIEPIPEVEEVEPPEEEPSIEPIFKVENIENAELSDSRKAKTRGSASFNDNVEEPIDNKPTFAPVENKQPVSDAETEEGVITSTDDIEDFVRNAITGGKQPQEIISSISNEIKSVTEKSSIQKNEKTNKTGENQEEQTQEKISNPQDELKSAYGSNQDFVALVVANSIVELISLGPTSFVFSLLKIASIVGLSVLDLFDKSGVVDKSNELASKDVSNSNEAAKALETKSAEIKSQHDKNIAKAKQFSQEYITLNDASINYQFEMSQNQKALVEAGEISPDEVVEFSDPNEDAKNAIRKQVAGISAKDSKLLSSINEPTSKAEKTMKISEKSINSFDELNEKLTERNENNDDMGDIIIAESIASQIIITGIIATLLACGPWCWGLVGLWAVALAENATFAAAGVGAKLASDKVDGNIEKNEQSLKDNRKTVADNLKQMSDVRKVMAKASQDKMANIPSQPEPENKQPGIQNQPEPQNSDNEEETDIQNKNPNFSPSFVRKESDTRSGFDKSSYNAEIDINNPNDVKKAKEYAITYTKAVNEDDEKSKAAASTNALIQTDTTAKADIKLARFNRDGAIDSSKRAKKVNAASATHNGRKRR